jgi:parallel beta-helix repeat protein
MEVFLRNESLKLPRWVTVAGLLGRGDTSAHTMGVALTCAQCRALFMLVGIIGEGDLDALSLSICRRNRIRLERQIMAHVMLRTLFVTVCVVFLGASAAQAIDGICGSANGNLTGTAPTTNLCSAGVPSLVIASEISGTRAWSWNCAGDTGGTIASCSAPAPVIQKPGPSAALFSTPYYSCVRNFYVANSGNNSNDGSSTSPWLTLQNADSHTREPGDCINVAPGTYHGMTIRHGGNHASAIGYVTYRCQTLDGCTIEGDAGPNRNSSFWFQTNGSANYVVIDGFVMTGAARGPYGIGVSVWNGTNGAQMASHHIWVINSIVSGFSQSGISFAAAEYFYALHNTVFENSRGTCDARGSGIALNIPHLLPGYISTSDDKRNPNPLIGPFVTGSNFFRNVFEWNVVHNNALMQCGTTNDPYNSDGNGIIMDTFSSQAGNSVEYVNPTLVAFNVVYNNGGGGIHIFNSEYVTVANNSCYNNYLDPYNRGSSRACIDSDNSYSNTYLNNIAVAIPPEHGTCAYSVAPYAMWNNAINGSLAAGKAPDTFSNNVTYIVGPNTSCQGEVGLWNGDTYSATANKKTTSPMWVNVGNTSPGTESEPPVGANFALQPGSPAIGYGLVKTYLPPQAADAGACSSKLTVCP